MHWSRHPNSRPQVSAALHATSRQHFLTARPSHSVALAKREFGISQTRGPRFAAANSVSCRSQRRQCRTDATKTSGKNFPFADEPDPPQHRCLHDSPAASPATDPIRRPIASSREYASITASSSAVVTSTISLLRDQNRRDHAVNPLPASTTTKSISSAQRINPAMQLLHVPDVERSCDVRDAFRRAATAFCTPPMARQQSHPRAPTLTRQHYPPTRCSTSPSPQHRISPAFPRRRAASTAAHAHHDPPTPPPDSPQRSSPNARPAPATTTIGNIATGPFNASHASTNHRPQFFRLIRHIYPSTRKYFITRTSAFFTSHQLSSPQPLSPTTCSPSHPTAPPEYHPARSAHP